MLSPSARALSLFFSPLMLTRPLILAHVHVRARTCTPTTSTISTTSTTQRFTSITRVHASPAGKGKRKKGLPKSKKIKKASQADGSFGGLPSPNFFINMIMRNAAHGNPFLGPLAARAGGIFLGGGPPQSLPPHIMLQMFSELNGVVSSRRSFGSEDSSMYDEDYEDEDDDNFLDDSDGDTDELFHTARLRASNLLGGILGGMPTSPPPNIRSHAKNDADENAGTADNALILSDSDDDAKQAKPATRKKPAKSAGPINIDLSDDEPDYHDCATGKSESGSVNSSGNGNGNGNGSDNSNSNSNSNANSNANSNVNSPIYFSKPSPGRKGPPIKRKKTEAGGGGAAKKKKSG